MDGAQKTVLVELIMAENNSSEVKPAVESFDSPNVIGGGLHLKGKVSGITKLSKKTKVVIIGSVALILALIIGSIMSIDDSPQDNQNRSKEQDKDKVVTFEPGPPPADALGSAYGIPSGDANGPGATLTPPGEGIATGGVVVPGEAQTPNPSPAIVLKDEGKPSASQPAGNDAQTVPDLSKIPGETGGLAAPAKQLTPEETAALQLKQLRLQKQAEAMDADVGVLKDSFGKSAASGGPLSTLAPGMPSQGPNGYSPGVVTGGQQQDDQNKQLRKERFLREAATQPDATYLKEVLHPALSKYEVKADSVIPAVLISGINSDLPGQIKAMVSETVFDSRTGRYPLIPQGAKLIGVYDSQVAFGQSRLLVIWNRLIFPDGSSISLQGMPGGDAAGSAGLTGNVNNHYWRTFISAGLLSVITAAAQLSQPAQQATSGGQASAPTIAQTLTAGLGQQLGQAGTAIIQKQLNVQPTITNKPGDRFFVMVNRDMIFPGPYGMQR